MVCLCLDGLNAEIRKIERLADWDYVRSRLLLPALSYAHKMKYIDDEEHAMLKVVAQKNTVQASDMKQVLKGLYPVTDSRKMKGLRDKKMLQPEKKGGNKYHLSFINNFLMRGMIQALEVEMLS